MKVPRRDAGETEFCIIYYNYYSFVLSDTYRMKYYLIKLIIQFRE
jgi:hypothetical protein